MQIYIFALLFRIKLHVYIFLNVSVTVFVTEMFQINESKKGTLFFPNTISYVLYKENNRMLFIA